MKGQADKKMMYVRLDARILSYAVQQPLCLLLSFF